MDTKKMMRRAQKILLFSLAALLTFGVCGAFAGKQELVYSMSYEVPGLDPQKSNAVPSFVVASHLWEGLVRQYGNKVLPGMAESWDISKDGKTYTFHLRDAVWSDGKPVTAYDFEYAFRRLVDPKTAASYAFAAYQIENGRAINKGEISDLTALGAKALDEKTFQITLTAPAEYFLSFLGLMCFAPVREDFVAEVGENIFATEADAMLYNGPFVMAEWKPEQVMELKKNPDYWNAEKVKLDGVTILQIYELNTALGLYEMGELDICEQIPSNLYEKYDKEGKAKVYLNGANDWMRFNLHPNPEKPWLANKNFRKAMNYAIDREEYLQIATKGLFFPNTRYVLPIVAGVEKTYGEEYPLSFYSKNAEPEKAKEYMKKALEELGISDPSTIEVTYLIQDQEETRIMAETLQDQIQRTLGIKFNVQLVTRKQRFLLEDKKEFDVVYSGWAPDYDDPMTYMELWETGNSQNKGGYSNPEYDKLIQLARFSTDKKERMDAFFAAEKIVLNDAAFVPLQLRRRAWASQPYVHDVERFFIGADLTYIYADVEGK